MLRYYIIGISAANDAIKVHLQRFVRNELITISDTVPHIKTGMWQNHNIRGFDIPPIEVYKEFVKKEYMMLKNRATAGSFLFPLDVEAAVFYPRRASFCV